MNADIAERTSLLALRLNAMLDHHLGQLQDELEADEFARYRLRFGMAMSALLDIINPIYRDHPELKPTQLDGSCVVPSWVFDSLEIDCVKDRQAAN